MNTRRVLPLVALAALALLAAACSDGNVTFPDSNATGDGASNDLGTDGDATLPHDDAVAPIDTVTPEDIGPVDVMSVYDTNTGGDGGCSADSGRPDGGACLDPRAGCVPTEVCGNGLDDNCNGTVDETCACIPGTVQDCFLGPPGLRHVGACHDGTQRCTGAGEFGTWGACQGGISPSGETCDDLDNNCNGCVDDGLCCHSPLTCPAPGDARVPDGEPFAAYPLRGELFYAGPARAWSWDVRGGPCDAVLPRPTFTLSDASGRDVIFTPTLSGDYTVTLTITLMDGTMLTCTFVVHIAGPGLRVELCWDTSTTVDLDLYLHGPRDTNPWFSSSGSPLTTTTNASCNWSNCEAILRGTMGRVSWGYASSPLSECRNGPHGADWIATGSCANPRLDIDNNLVKSSGSPENINVDNPHDGDRFRVMVENFTGTAAHPVVNVYCGGHLRGTIGAAPDTLPDFTGTPGYTSVGAMWRAVDVAVHVDAAGTTTGCDVTPLHPPGATTGFFVTHDDPSY